MKTLHKTALFLAASFACLAWTVRSAAESPVREKNSFDEGWKFALGNAADKVKDFEYCVGMPLAKTGSDRNAYGAILADFNDSAWRTVDLPHDWAVELPFMTDPKYFPQTPWYVFHHGYKPVGPPFPETSVGWYRKSFDIPRTDDGRRISIVFDGAFRDTEVWLNNYRIGRHEGGYTGFRFDITDYLKFGGKNTLSVRVDAGKYEGWFYEGAGIYRHVWMEKTNPLHITPLGLKVVADGAGKVTARVGIANDGSAAPRALEANVAILDADGRTVAQASQAMQIGEAVDLPELVVADPKLWSPETPNLYRYAVELRANGKVVDQVKTTFGVRVIAFDPEKGLLLNGKRVQIKGACCHQDHAGVGVAVPDSLLEWRLRELKKWGFNAYRTSHHAPAPELLDLCDRLGVMVLDENRNIGSSPDVLDDLRFLVERDRNHPCVIAWSMGNEEVVQSTPQAARFGATMKKLVRRLDGTRPVTYACNGGADTRGIMGQMDVFGINYTRIGDFDGLHRRCPDLPMFGTEEGSAVYTRGDYNQRHVSAYDIHLGGGWARQAEDWMKHFSSRQWLAGAFLWTGFDYRGEPCPVTPGRTSVHISVCSTPAAFPRTWLGTIKPAGPMNPCCTFSRIELAGREGQPIDVWCYSNHEEVELFLNGKSLGRQAMPHLGHAAWKVNYAPGRLTAKGYRQGQVVEETAVATTGAPPNWTPKHPKPCSKPMGKTASSSMCPPATRRAAWCRRPTCRLSSWYQKTPASWAWATATRYAMKRIPSSRCRAKYCR